jgi:hypothetical protein
MALLGALAVGLYLFATGRITFPSKRFDSVDWVIPNAWSSRNVSVFTPRWFDTPSDPGEAGLPAPLFREAAARHVSRDGRYALIVSTAPELSRGIDWVSYGHPIFLFLRMPPDTIEEPWEAPPKKDPPPPDGPATMRSLMRAGATILASGRLPFRWPLVHVLEDGGYVLVPVESRDLEWDGSGAIALRYDIHGSGLWGRSYSSVLKRAVDVVPFSVDRRVPQHGMWVDESRGVVAIVDDADALHALSLADGSTLADVDEIALTVAAIRGGPSAERVVALDLALLRLWDQAVPAAQEALADSAASESVRLRAACVLSRHGDVSGRDLVAEIARRPPQEHERRPHDVAMAWLHLGECLGASSIPMYVERLSLPASAHLAYIDSEVNGLAALGDDAFDPAIELTLGVPDESSLFQRYQRLLTMLRAGEGNGDHTLPFAEQKDWQHLRQQFGAADLVAVLSQGVDPVVDHGKWSVLVLPAARWATLNPRPDFVEPLRVFRAAFAADPQSRDAWRDRVLVEVDAALAACAKR